MIAVAIENTMLVSFDVKTIRRDQKQRRTGEALVEPDKLDPVWFLSDFRCSLPLFSVIRVIY